MTSYAQIRHELAGALSGVYAPGCELNCWEWAEENIFLTPEESRDNHGKYDTSLTIYVRRLMEFVTTPDETEFIIRKSAQLGFTLAYIIIIAYLAATRQTHVLYAMDSIIEARRICTNRLQPMLKNCLATAEAFTGADEDVTSLMVRLRGMIIYMIGSGSAGQFGNKSIGFAILDELDKHKPAPGGEANTIDLARERLKEVQDGKLVAGGTPVEWDGETNQNFLSGTREELHLPCPHCDHFQPIHWEQMRFNHCKDEKGNWDYKRLRNETYLECANKECAQPIREEHKAAALRRSCWRVMNTGQDEHKPFPGRVSIWINDLYSQRPKNSWGNLAVKWIGSLKSPSKILNFFNSILGLPRRETAMETKKEDVARLAGGYDHGCMPIAPAVNPISGLPAIVLMADVQLKEKKWVKAGFTAGGECFVIDYGSCATYEELNIIAERPVFIGMKFPDEREMTLAGAEAITTNQRLADVLRKRFPGEWYDDIAIGGVDEGRGEDTQGVRAFCLSTTDAKGFPRFYPTKGVARANVRDMVDEKLNRFFVDGVPITVYHFSDEDMKRELYVGRIGEFDKIVAGTSATPRLHLPAYPEQDFIDELSQEKRSEIKFKGKKVMRWLEPKGPNDYGDGTKGCLVLWHVIKSQYGGGAPTPVPEDPPDEPAGPEMDEDGRITRPGDDESAEALAGSEA
ncbi:MAG: hypothetical protein K0R17_2755 [Rariglobus sp.]|jgi:phage terminase large subunit GpA-like protein|nr:hypothetical protein [Rariglobus sp.]